MKTLLPADLSHRDRHQLLLAGVSPRPIALVASVGTDGTHNLAPFSFFNAYSSKPPIVAIGPAIAAKTGIAKDTLVNIAATKECTISVVTYSLVHKVNLAAGPYPSSVDEFVKAGLTKAQSEFVAPPYVADSPYAMECILMENIELRRDIGGNGTLMLLEVVAFHVADSVWGDNGFVDPHRMDLVGRMGQSWYTRTQDSFQAVQPPHVPIGFDNLPDHIKHSTILTGNDLAQLAYVEVLPMLDGTFPQFPPGFTADLFEVELASSNPMGALYALLRDGSERSDVHRHRVAKVFIAQGLLNEAWQTLLLV